MLHELEICDFEIAVAPGGRPIVSVVERGGGGGVYNR